QLKPSNQEIATSEMGTVRSACDSEPRMNSRHRGVPVRPKSGHSANARVYGYTAYGTVLKSRRSAHAGRRRTACSRHGIVPVYAARRGGAYDGHHGTAGIAGCSRRRGGGMATRGAGAATGKDHRVLGGAHAFGLEILCSCVCAKAERTRLD